MSLLNFFLDQQPKQKLTGFNILIAGEGGQGVQTIGEILTRSVLTAGFFASYIPNFGVEQRGGVSLAFVKIKKEEKTDYPKFEKADLIVLMTKRAVPRIKSYVNENTLILDLCDQDFKPFNMVSLGVLARAIKEMGLELKSEKIENAIKEKLGKKPGIEENLAGFKKGLEEIQIKPQKNLPLYHSRPLNQWKSLVDKNKKIVFVRFPELCKGCGLCIERCPNKALLWNNEAKGVYGNLIPKVNLEKCDGCGLCEQTCPDCAIKVSIDARFLTSNFYHLTSRRCTKPPFPSSKN